MLLMAAQLTALQWAILAADAGLLAVLSPALRWLLRHEVAPPFVGTVARRWPVLLGNTLLLLVAFVAHDYAFGFADTRALSWNALVAQTMHSAQAGAACPATGTLLGVAAVADQLPRHAARSVRHGPVNVTTGRSRLHATSPHAPPCRVTHRVSSPDARAWGQYVAALA